MEVSVSDINAIFLQVRYLSEDPKGSDAAYSDRGLYLRVQCALHHIPDDGRVLCLHLTRNVSSNRSDKFVFFENISLSWIGMQIYFVFS